MSKDFALTTVDNPYSPFDQFDSWFLYDVENGYNSCGMLARLTNVTDDMSSVEEDEEIARAIEEIIKNDFLGLYVKAYRDDYPLYKNKKA